MGSPLPHQVSELNFIIPLDTEDLKSLGTSKQLTSNMLDHLILDSDLDKALLVPKLTVSQEVFLQTELTLEDIKRFSDAVLGQNFHATILFPVLTRGHYWLFVAKANAERKVECSYYCSLNLNHNDELKKLQTLIKHYYLAFGYHIQAGNVQKIKGPAQYNTFDCALYVYHVLHTMARKESLVEEFDPYKLRQKLSEKYKG